MAEMESMTAATDAFAVYARDSGIAISDVIKPHRFPGRGLGIAASRKILVCSAFLVSPRRFLASACFLNSENKFTDPVST